MTHGSLFSGVGGFDIAAEWMGWKNLFNCEINPFCRKVLDYHFKESIGYEDITKTYFSEWRGKVDVLTGGFPCQPFSCAGQRKGADDDRYLWPQMLRVIREVRPTWVVGENVAGILSMVQPGEEFEVGNEASLFGETDRKRTLLQQEFVVETVCSDLEREGYTVQPLLIPACAVGAPHRRDRVWFVARRVTSDTPCNGDSGRPEEICGESRGQDGKMYAKSVKHGCLQAGFIADANSNRRGDWKDKQDTITRSEGETDNRDGCTDGTSSYPECERLQERKQGGGWQDKEEAGAREDNRVKRPCRIGDAADTCFYGLERERIGRKDCQKRRKDADRLIEEHSCNDREPLPADRWHDFPTQSPIRWRYDGISANMVRYINDKVYDELYKYFGIENLSRLWSHFQKKEIREEIGRLYKIPQPDLLLEVLQRTSKEWGCEQRPCSLSSHSERTSERVLRYLRNNREFAGASHRQEYKEQCREQSSDIMRKLSHEIALATKKIVEECEKTASWVRQESVKAYGNAIVPPVAYEIFRAIEAVSNYENEPTIFNETI